MQHMAHYCFIVSTRLEELKATARHLKVVYAILRDAWAKRAEMRGRMNLLFKNLLQSGFTKLQSKRLDLAQRSIT